MSDDEALTFSELRKIQKQERRQDELGDLGEDFIADVVEYLSRKKEMAEGSREYRNAERVFQKIISLREDKIVKNAKLAVTSKVEQEELNLLPREKELFRKLKENFTEHREKMLDTENRGNVEIQEKASKEESKEEEIGKTGEEEENVEDSSEPETDVEEGYRLVKITSEVPEFMGTDLESYGPFEEGEEAEIPEENAEILENRGNAEVLI
ncbi:MAG: hypothetical protein ABEJ93_03940 [Candidatus Nanohalobium sp.]